MTKPLHEQLREWVNESKMKGFYPTIVAAGEFGLDDDSLRNEERNLFLILADRIENEYYLLPCDEEGKPWKYMDECVYGENTYSVVGVDNERNVCVFYEGEYKWVHASRIKRPAPPVLDADGVPCKVGDTVWSITDREHEPLRVKELAKDNKFKADGCPDTFYFIASSFTREQPVFDADGVRICKSDTVWDIDSGEELTVEDFPNRKCGLVQCSGEDGDCDDHDAHNLTHQEPDSLEKLQDFIGALSNVHRNNQDLHLQLEKAYDMCTALIERGA